MIRALVPDDVDALGHMLLALAGVLLPLLIGRSQRGSATARFRSRDRETILFQVFLAALCAWTAWTNRILSMPLPQRSLISWSAAMLMYVFMVVTLKLRWPSRTAASKQRLYDILPHGAGELLPYAVLCIVAGTAEEFVYRAVLTELSQRLIGIAIVTIITISIGFAAAHAM
ncbi:MAG TPA: CPBP family glutamic-type intramembrane protease, partial [Thermoanaerobaculia bacterium]|nr:CPBP family glutamic-type intramembrane protease [Thermoanaerobaculia bacterium]